MKVETTKFIKRIAKNIRGYRTNRKIVVIESDDWGSIRMPSREIYQKWLKMGYRVDQIAYERYDSLASEDDLELLFDLLLSFKDRNENHPVITANALTANPDFDKIRDSGFQNYEYELITETFKRYPCHSNCLSLWKKGLESGVFFMQSHGREHLNVSEFMSALQSGDKDVHVGFDHRMPGSIPKNRTTGNRYVEALRYTSKQDKQEKLDMILEGLNLFEKLFGYRSESFIPPNYIWSPDFNEAVSKQGVRFIQGQRKLKEPIENGHVQYHANYTGKRNRFGQTYLVRNAVFEPSLSKQKSGDPVDSCLKDISAAFRMKKPAIITSHRINYVGFIDESNRDQNLKRLERLLNEILKRWSDVEFMNSAELGRLIEGESR